MASAATDKARLYSIAATATMFGCCLLGLWCVTIFVPLLTSRWGGGWQLAFRNHPATVYWWILSSAALLILGGTLFFFQSESRLVSRPLSIILRLMRSSLVLVLYFALLMPVWEANRQSQNFDHLYFAIDVSRSMDTADSQATFLEKLRSADAIGLFGSGPRAVEIRQQISRLEAEEATAKTGQFLADSNQSDRDSKTNLIETQTVNSQLQELNGKSRLQLLSQSLRTVNQDLLPQLSQSKNLLWNVFAEDSVSLTEPDLETLGSSEFLLERMNSDLKNVLENALKVRQQKSLSRVILMSDGRDTLSKGTEDLSQFAHESGLVIDTVLVGSELAPKDLAIMHVEHPETVFLKDQPRIRGLIRTSGFQGMQVNVYLQSLDSDSSTQLTQAIDVQGAMTEIEFVLPEETIGRHRYRMWMDVLEGETREDNNSSDFAFNVVDERSRVLLVDGESRWEFRYLDAALSRDNQISLECVLFEQPYLGVLKEPFFHTSFDTLRAVNLGSTRFSSFDVVILGDVSPQHLSDEIQKELDKFVRVEGGTLICLSGKKYLPAAFPNSVLSELLPITNPQEMLLPNEVSIGPPQTRGFRVQMTTDGLAVGVLQLDSDVQKSSEIWSKLPGHLWGMTGEIKSGANVWATPSLAGIEQGLVFERQHALIAHGFAGAGQVVWLGIDSTWRWRYLVGDLYHHRFWGQLMRWAVAFKSAAGNEDLRIALRNSVIQEGGSTQVQVRVSEKFTKQFPDVKLEAVVRRISAGRQFTQTIPLVPRSESLIVREADLSNLPAGEFRIGILVTNGEPQEDFEEIGLTVNAQMTSELQTLEANRQLLEELSAATGGTFYHINEISNLIESILNQERDQLKRVQTIDLHSHWAIAVLFCGLAMSEWVIRKLHGLP